MALFDYAFEHNRVECRRAHFDAHFIFEIKHVIATADVARLPEIPGWRKFRGCICAPTMIPVSRA
jgi:hypothetical protein